MVDITGFELIPSEIINEKIFYFPEVEPFSLNFQVCGIDSRYFLEIMGLPLYIMHGHIALFILYVLLYFINRVFKCKCLKKIVKYIGALLLWNGLIRLYMELYQDLSQSSFLNMYTADWQTRFFWVNISNYYGLFGLILVTGLPLLIFIPFYCRRRTKWSKKKF